MPRAINKKTKLTHGVGINDADYVICPTVNGKQVMCPYYLIWRGMLARCYDPKCRVRYSAYIDCSVTKEWLTFSSFKSWMAEQNWEGKQLDKDILIQGNKVYGPENCLFVTQAINKLLNDNNSKRGEWPVGVCFCKPTNKFQASCNAGGKRKYLGVYSTPEEASDAYNKFKYGVIADIANQQSEPLRSALMNYVIN